MSRRKPGMCAACKLLPAMDGSVMCQGCKNRARKLVAAYMARDEQALVRSPPGSGMLIGREIRPGS